MPAAPRVSAELPETGERFEGLLPPVVAAPAFAIRKPAVAVFTLDDYVAAGIMTSDAGRGPAHGGRRSAKTSWSPAAPRPARPRLTNALLAEVAKTADRVVLIEDTRELQCKAPNLVALAHQGRRGLAVRSRALVAAPAPRPHPDRRGARRRSARSAQGLGHRPSRRHRHHPRRHRARRAAPARAADPGSRRHRAARPDRRNHRHHRRACRPRRGSSARRTRRASPGSVPPATTALSASRRPT